MAIEIIGMVGTRGRFRDTRPPGRRADSGLDGRPFIDPGYLVDISKAHDDAGFDRVLIGYGAVGPEGWAVAATVLHHTKHLKVMVAHRPGFVQPALLARKAATLDHLTGGGRVAIHFITGGDEADQRREGDFVPHDARYRRTGEVMSILRRIWSEDSAFDFEGEFFRYEAAFSSVKRPPPARSPSFSPAPPLRLSRLAQPRRMSTRLGEPRDSAAARKQVIDKAAAAHGRTMRYSISFRPINC